MGLPYTVNSVMIIYLEDKRREVTDWFPKIQHLVAGVPLLYSGVANLKEAAERVIGGLEIAIALLLIAAFLKELREARHRAAGHHTHSAVGSFDIAAAGLLIFEAFHGAHHKPGYMRPQFFSGIATLGLGLFHARLHARKSRTRFLRVDEQGLEMRLSPFRRLHVGWEELARVEHAGSHAVLHRKDGGRHKLPLSRFRNRQAIEDGIATHAPTNLIGESPTARG